ncbi:acetate and sugar kinases/Hsc70/actin family protein [Paenibacillus hexagrammi]|uniref:Actin-like protein N-terminal domain-containing protein n=1 Tax=Paenibacillus hexagrammi TaxID=2908839 RepID=A0ABY3SRC3_9BACL|nr:hypothetical protein [Paenibacillus sp. YPD9-1]UJF36608.1 hypothetical protein L0M14_30430 [Paenibacillus sp. YPD9-1]
MVKKFVVVLDPGNGTMKYFADGMAKPESVAAAIARYKPVSTSTKISKGRKPAQAFKVGDDSQQWVIGYEDIESFKLDPILLSGRDGLARYSNPMYALYAKMGLAKAIGKNKPSEILLITSTPAYESKKPAVLEKLDALFRDFHKVWTDDSRNIYNVSQYETVSETEAVLYDIYFAEDGSTADEKILSQDVLVINVGFGTTDLSRYSSLEYLPLDRETIKTSYLDVVKKCRDWLEAAVGREITLEEVAMQLDQQKNAKTKVFKFVDNEINGFNEVYQSALLSVFDEIVTEISVLVDDTFRFSRVIVVGGPAEDTVWGNLFKSWSSRVTIPDEPQFSPTRGMYKYGKFFVLANEETATEKE